MPYAWSGVCHETPEGALAAFVLSVPSTDGNAVNWFNSTPIISSTGLISYSINNRDWSSGIVSARSGSIQLPTCTYDSLASISLADLGLTIALVLCLLIGFRMGQAA